MTHALTLYCMKKMRAQEMLSKEEYENACYSLEILLINIFKVVQVYLVAFLAGTLFETLIMHIAYVGLRMHADGWHAQSSLACSLIGIVSFVGIPWCARLIPYTPNTWLTLVLALFILLNVFLYAPADTEKNPLVSASERKRKKRRALLSAILILLFSCFYQNGQWQLLLVLGLLLETLMIHPLFYKLLKRSYKNYENWSN